MRLGGNAQMNIIWHEKTKQFHLCTDAISYILYVQPLSLIHI